MTSDDTQKSHRSRHGVHKSSHGVVSRTYSLIHYPGRQFRLVGPWKLDELQVIMGFVKAVKEDGAPIDHANQ
ncbi:hypothetical protein MLD38_034428 [Melastoma candidum]|uniref:Uncharacterized protein n=1 Tax=Melastoma candidum TaxID=119954 RepID=A0ACB9MC86_9MYRT|nr:hypothetical protein MLD38_034428 [Melastoma candidum]